MMQDVERARKKLKADLADCPYTLDNPFGHAGTYRKIQDYLFTCVVENEDRVKCKDWLYKLYDAQTEYEKDKFVSKVDLLANALYDFYNYLQKGI